MIKTQNRPKDRPRINPASARDRSRIMLNSSGATHGGHPWGIPRGVTGGISWLAAEMYGHLGADILDRPFNPRGAPNIPSSGPTKKTLVDSRHPTVDFGVKSGC